jgi:hypothetical protein
MRRRAPRVAWPPQERRPDRLFLDEQHVLRFALFEFDDVLFGDAGNAPPARTHPGKIDLVTRVHDHHGPDHAPLLVGEKVELLAQGVEADLEILDDRIAFDLVVEGVLAASFDGVLGHVEKVADARGLAALQEVFAGAGDQKRLHEFLGHRQVEKLARLHFVAELDVLMLLAERDVGERPDRDLEGRVLGPFDLAHGFGGQFLDLAEGHFSPLGPRFVALGGCH